MFRNAKKKNLKMNKRNADNSLLLNVVYVTKTLFQTYHETIWATPVYIICRVLLPLLTAVIPAVAISAITDGNPGRFLWMMTGILLAEMLFRMLHDYTDITLRNRRVYTRIKVFYVNYLEKSLTVDYEKLEPAECQAEFTKGAKAVVSNFHGVERLMTESVEFIVHILGLITFGTAVFSLDYRILLILVFMFAIDLILRGCAVRYDNKNRIVLSEIHRKQEYLERGSLTLAAGKDVRVYQMEGWFHQISEKLLSQALAYFKASGLRWYFPVLGNTICLAAQELVTYFILITMVLKGYITVAEFTLQLGLVRGFSQWIYGVSVSHGALQKANGEMNDYNVVMNIKECKESVKTVVPRLTGAPEIAFHEVSFVYPGEEQPALSNVSFTIKPQEKIAIVGNNGAGKTTLVKLLCGLYQPTSGYITVNGEDISRYSLVQYQKLLSVVFQDVSVLSFTIEMNVAGTTPEFVDKKRVEEVLKKVGLWEKVKKLPQGMETYITQELDKGGVQLSGGETQKLLLARAMYRNGPILILDEPTSALDPIAESRLYEEYNHLTEDKTSLFISHRLASTKFCDRIILLEDGKIKELGCHEELMNSQGEYKKLFDIQSHYYKEEVSEDE